MKKQLLLVLLFFISKSAYTQSGRHAVGIKPLNYSNIAWNSDHNDYSGPQFGLEYEYCFSKNKKFSVVVPFTYGSIRKNSDFGSGLKGREFYLTPGLKFYPGTVEQSRHSFGLHLLMGNAAYNYTGLFINGDVTLNYLGCLANYNYSLRLWRSFFLKPEAGIGCRFQSKKDDFIFLNDVGPDNDWIPGTITADKAVVILNLSLGLHYRF
ncbi:MAG: hypothetical protein EOP54_06495 [Sphingobacteriales bacterium]|nr:MAG: hypothetical protein EOP54_06495 [Sphingobacteriales bacterium]